MFKVRGKDGKEYGPASIDDVRLWLQQGRVNGDTEAVLQGSNEWKPLKEYPEFSHLAGPASSPPPPLAAPEGRPVMSGMAIASLVCGVLGLVTFGLAGLVGIVLGIVALMKINKSQGRLSGSGLAIAGICVSGAMLLLLPIMAAMLLPALAKAKSKAQSIQCMNNVKQLNLALIMYANDNKDQLPPESSWCDLIKPYTGNSEAMFHCPHQPPGRCSYAYNAALANRKLTDIREPARTVLVFSSGEGWNQSGRKGSIVAHGHSGKSACVGFLDGHSEIATPERWPTMAWEP